VKQVDIKGLDGDLEPLRCPMCFIVLPQFEKIAEVRQLGIDVIQEFA
jgi:hypothetical protein